MQNNKEYDSWEKQSDFVHSLHKKIKEVNARIFILLLTVSAFLSLQVWGQKGIHATKTGDRIDITIHGRYFTGYHFPENEKYPFFFPVNGPVSGSSLTSMRNGEYPHHSSLFFGCDRVNGGNFWQEGLERGRIASQGAVIAEQDSMHVVIEDKCLWVRPDVPPPVRDLRRIVVTAPSPGMVYIDFEITIEMLTDVTIEKTNHSLFSVRMDPDLSVRYGGVMVNAGGDSAEKATFGKYSPWMDCYGTRGTITEGIAIMQHPWNLDYPAPWFTRDYGFFSPTSLYWPADNKATYFDKGTTLTLRYRVLVHEGNTQTAGIAGEFEKYRKAF